MEATTAPVQIDTPPEIDVEQGASYTANALSSFNDPDGDPLTLVSAVAQNTDQVQVSTRADGQLTFNTGALASGRAGVEVTVSDGRQPAPAWSTSRSSPRTPWPRSSTR